MSREKTKVNQNLVMTSEGIDSDIELPKDFKVSSALQEYIKKVEGKVENKGKVDENKK